MQPTLPRQTHYDESALYVLADVAKRLRQLEECDLTDEDFASKPGRMVRQSLAINRSLAYTRHVDLVQRAVPPLPDPSKKMRHFALTLDVDSRFLAREKLVHLKAVGILLNKPPPPPASAAGAATSAATAGNAAGTGTAPSLPAAPIAADPAPAKKGWGWSKKASPAAAPAAQSELSFAALAGGSDSYFLH